MSVWLQASFYDCPLSRDNFPNDQWTIVCISGSRWTLEKAMELITLIHLWRSAYLVPLPRIFIAFDFKSHMFHDFFYVFQSREKQATPQATNRPRAPHFWPRPFDWGRFGPGALQFRRTRWPSCTWVPMLLFYISKRNRVNFGVSGGGRQRPLGVQAAHYATCSASLQSMYLLMYIWEPRLSELKLGPRSSHLELHIVHSVWILSCL